MYHRRKNKKKKFFIILLGVFITLFFVGVFFQIFSPNFLAKGVLWVGQPFFSFKSSIVSFYDNKISLLKSKEDLQNENKFLKEKIKELEIRGQFSDVILNENIELKALLSQETEGKDLLMAYILARPGYGLYNSLIINKGFEHGVNEGMMVVAFGDVLLGYVSEVMSGTSRIKLISHPGEETNVFIENSVSAIAVGQGGENLEISLPHDIAVKVGNKILTFGSEPLFLGVIEKIVRESADPFQKIVFRLPINIQELQRVYLVK